MNRSRPLIAVLIPLLTGLVIAGNLEAQSFRVLVLDAVSGKPQKQMQVLYACEDRHRNYPPDEDDTDSGGIVVIADKCKGEDPKIAIGVTGLPKEQCGASFVVASFEEISSQGIVSAPDAAGEMQCTTKISRNLKPIPGQVVIFVKKPSWWQSHF